MKLFVVHLNYIERHYKTLVVKAKSADDARGIALSDDWQINEVVEIDDDLTETEPIDDMHIVTPEEEAEVLKRHYESARSNKEKLSIGEIAKKLKSAIAALR